jgi:hypothetical protein
MLRVIAPVITLFLSIDLVFAQTPTQKADVEKIVAQLNQNFCGGVAHPQVQLAGSTVPREGSYNVYFLVATGDCNGAKGLWMSTCDKRLEGGWYCTKPSRTQDIWDLK